MPTGYSPPLSSPIPASPTSERTGFFAGHRQALELGGYPEDTLIPGMNGGSVVTTGFAHHAVLSHAEEIVQAVHEGAIRHFFLIGGCDGTRPSRRYYTDFAKLTPPDTVILTLACGKFRLNDLPLGTVAGLPRILDVGQCNDATVPSRSRWVWRALLTARSTSCPSPSSSAGSSRRRSVC